MSAPSADATRQRRSDSERLASIVRVQGEIAAGGLDLQPILQLVVRNAQEITGASAAVVELAEGDEMVNRAASGTAAAHVGLRLKQATSITIAGRLQACVRESDTVARLGGDEFVVVLRDVGDHENVAGIVAKLCSEIELPVPVNGGEARVRGSIGVSIYPDDGQDIDTLLRHADDAMYQAKGDSAR